MDPDKLLSMASVPFDDYRPGLPTVDQSSVARYIPPVDRRGKRAPPATRRLALFLAGIRRRDDLGVGHPALVYAVACEVVDLLQEVRR